MDISNLRWETSNDGRKYITGSIRHASELHQYHGHNLMWFSEKEQCWRTAGNIGQYGDVDIVAIYPDEQFAIQWRIDPPGKNLGATDLDVLGHR